MNVSLITIRYAKALFSLALEKGLLAEVYGDVKLISHQFDSVANFQAVLDSPVIKPAQKRELFISVFGNNVNEITLKFMHILIANQREALLKSVLIDFEDLYKKHLGVKDVRMVTAVPLGADFEGTIKTFLTKELNSNIEFTTEIKPDLLGGFILVVDGKMLDTSLSSKLRLMKKSLLA